MIEIISNILDVIFAFSFALLVAAIGRLVNAIRQDKNE